jgi:hypothetical protein
MRKLFLIFTTILISFSYYSCKRELLFNDNGSMKINNAKVWFDNFLKTNTINPVFKNIEYHWDKASKFTFKNGYEAITIPITEINQNPEYYGKRILYLFPWKNAKGYYSSVFEVIPELTHLKNNYDKINLKKFDGIISTWDLKTGFLRGIKYEAGTGVSNIKLELKRAQSISLPEHTNSVTYSTNLPPVTVIGYIPSANWNSFWISLMGNLGYNTSSLWGGSGGNPCEYSGCGGSENPGDYIDPNSFVEPNNNDDNDGITEVKDITDDVDDPCLKGTLNSVTSSNLGNGITDILHNTFGGTADFNIHFQDDALNNNMKDGKTHAVIWGSGRMDFDITLNTETLPDASKEFTAATIYHEILHAYLRTTGIIGDLQHIAMANDYTSKLASSLLSAYPNLDPLDAKALAWGGLEGTPAYDSIRTNHPSEFTDLQSRNAQHRVHTKGTPCN